MLSLASFLHAWTASGDRGPCKQKHCPSGWHTKSSQEAPVGAFQRRPATRREVAVTPSCNDKNLPSISCKYLQISLVGTMQSKTNKAFSVLRGLHLEPQPGTCFGTLGPGQSPLNQHHGQVSASLTPCSEAESQQHKPKWFPLCLQIKRLQRYRKFPGAKLQLIQHFARLLS